MCFYFLFLARNALPAKNKKSNNSSGGTFEPQPGVIPVRVSFLEELSGTFTSVFPELWKIGQAYFHKELYVRVELSKQEEFKVTIRSFSAFVWTDVLTCYLLDHDIGRSNNL